MATVFERVPLDAIEAEAKEIHFRRAVLTMIAAVLVTAGWLAYQPLKAIAWSFAAVKVGWRLAHEQPPDGGG